MTHTHAETEYSQITENIFVGTNLCCTTSPHAQVLTDLGITAEVDMEEERTASPPKIDIYLWLPTKDHTAPKQDQLDAGVALIEKAVNMNRKIYIHCKLGHGRGPTMAAAYFIFKGSTTEEAIDKIKQKRSEIHLEEVQKQVLNDYFRRIREDE